MPSSYTDLGLELMVTGENSGTWGDKTNTNLKLFNKQLLDINSNCCGNRNYYFSITGWYYI
jgi:hypothetical protein